MRDRFHASTSAGVFRETNPRKIGPRTGGRGRIRTSVARKGRQVYSLLPLAARPPVQKLRVTECRSLPREPCPTTDSPLAFLPQSFRIQTFHADDQQSVRLILPAGNQPASPLIPPRSALERETGIEPATNSLEGCDSTTELLPPPKFLEPMTGIEPVTSSLPRTRSTN